MRCNLNFLKLKYLSGVPKLVRNVGKKIISLYVQFDYKIMRKYEDIEKIEKKFNIIVCLTEQV